MKKNLMKISLALLLIVGSGSAYAQCDTTVVLESSATNYLDSTGKVTRSKDEASTVTISKTNVTISYGDQEHTLSGKVTDYACDWKKPFKEGKTTVKAIINGPNDMKMQVTLTITGVAGQIIMIYQAKERPGVRIQLQADTFAAKKI